MTAKTQNAMQRSAVLVDIIRTNNVGSDELNTFISTSLISSQINRNFYHWVTTMISLRQRRDNAWRVGWYSWNCLSRHYLRLIRCNYLSSSPTLLWDKYLLFNQQSPSTSVELSLESFPTTYHFRRSSTLFIPTQNKHNDHVSQLVQRWVTIMTLAL